MKSGQNCAIKRTIGPDNFLYSKSIIGERKMNYKICVVIPTYKEKLSEKEKKAILNNCKCLNGIRKFFIVPENLDCTFYQKYFPKVRIVRFPDKYFRDIEAYNKLMLSIKFYSKFKKYKYMLICQADVWLLKQTSDLDKIVQQGYDYIGAPWFPKMRIQFPDEKYTRWYFREYRLSVGNGGLSLRNINSTISILKRYFLLKCIWKKNEDLFFSFIGEIIDYNFKIPSVEVAKKFSLESKSQEIIKREKQIPFGVHAYDKYYPKLPYESQEIYK